MTQPVVEAQNHSRLCCLAFATPSCVCWPVFKLRLSVTFPLNTVLIKTTLLYFTLDWMEFCSGVTCYILLCEFHFGLH